MAGGVETSTVGAGVPSFCVAVGATTCATKSDSERASVTAKTFLATHPRSGHRKVGKGVIVADGGAAGVADGG